MRLAREDFLVYRQLINPKLKVNWWVQELSIELQEFARALANKEKPSLVIQAPPQHGKSSFIVDFIGWLLGKYPDLRNMYSSYSERLGVRANLTLQRTLDKTIYKKIFPTVYLNGKDVVIESGTKLRNKEFFEIVKHEGSFRNTTVQGAMTGETLDLGIIDDPIKDRKEANSETTRNNVWEWFTDVFLTRFDEDAGMLFVLTRWHLDDPVGRLLKIDKTVKLLSYPAIATVDEPHRKIGEVLIPEHKSLEFILKRKEILSAENFEALYQQNPVLKSGNMFKYDWFNWWTLTPKIKYKIITVDTAQKTKEQNDFTVMQAWGYGYDENLYLLDMKRGKFEAPQLRREAKAFYNKHNDTKLFTGVLRYMYIEDKSSGSSLIQDLKENKMKIKAVQRNTDKVSRAYDTIPTIEAGRVYLNENVPDIEALTNEALSFPNGVHDDTLDPMMDAIEIMDIQKVNPLVAAMRED